MNQQSDEQSVSVWGLLPILEMIDAELPRFIGSEIVKGRENIDIGRMGGSLGLKSVNKATVCAAYLHLYST